MTRDEALALIDDLPYMSGAAADESRAALRTYILNSIPTPKVEVVQHGRHYRVSVNGYEGVYAYNKYVADRSYNALIAALGIEVKP